MGIIKKLGKARDEATAEGRHDLAVLCTEAMAALEGALGTVALAQKAMAKADADMKRHADEIKARL